LIAPGYLEHSAAPAHTIHDVIGEL
jgi:hypothetical protein